MARGGGQLQLVAEGAQDAFLTYRPETTYFKKVYKRHTPFAIESIPMFFNGAADFGRKVICEVPAKLGDLLGPMHLEISLPAIYDATTGAPVPWTNSIGHAIIQEIKIEIGEQEIDKQSGEWMEIWTQHTVSASHKATFNEMIGRRTENAGYCSGPIGAQTLTVPLQFWFCRDPGLWLPMCVIQTMPVRFVLTLRPLSELHYKTSPTDAVQPASMVDLRLWGDFVHLSVEERRRFVSGAQEQLIEQVQTTPYNSIAPRATSKTVPIEFNHCIKEFFWWIRPDRLEALNEWMNFSTVAASETGGRSDVLGRTTIQFEGLDRFEARVGTYFRTVQPLSRHTYSPYDRYIYMYSFAIYPESDRPSGSVNVSAINSVAFQMDVVPAAATAPERGFCSMRAYATNYNVLRFVEGGVGLLFRA